MKIPHKNLKFLIILTKRMLSLSERPIESVLTTHYFGPYYVDGNLPCNGSDLQKKQHRISPGLN